MYMHKPWGRMVTHVALGEGTPFGCVRRRWRLGTPQFELVRDDKRVGLVRAQNWRSREFTLVDEKGGKLASAQRRRPAGNADPVPGDADQYLIGIVEDADQRLRSFALGAVLALEAVVPHGD